MKSNPELKLMEAVERLNLASNQLAGAKDEHTGAKLAIQRSALATIASGMREAEEAYVSLEAELVAGV